MQNRSNWHPQDLSDLDFSQFKPMPFEIARKEASLNMRLPTALMDAVRVKAKARGVPYARYVRMVLEADLQRPDHPPPRSDPARPAADSPERVQ